jgi:hypothetical protein
MTGCREGCGQQNSAGAPATHFIEGIDFFSGQLRLFSVEFQGHDMLRLPEWIKGEMGKK